MLCTQQVADTWQAKCNLANVGGIKTIYCDPQLQLGRHGAFTRYQPLSVKHRGETRQFAYQQFSCCRCSCIGARDHHCSPIGVTRCITAALTFQSFWALEYLAYFDRTLQQHHKMHSRTVLTLKHERLDFLDIPASHTSCRCSACNNWCVV